MSWGEGRRHGSDLVLLRLRCRPAAIALIRPPAWEPPYAAGAALKSKKKKKEKKRNESCHVDSCANSGTGAPLSACLQGHAQKLSRVPWRLPLEAGRCRVPRPQQSPLRTRGRRELVPSTGGVIFSEPDALSPKPTLKSKRAQQPGRARRDHGEVPGLAHSQGRCTARGGSPGRRRERKHSAAGGGPGGEVGGRGGSQHLSGSSHFFLFLLFRAVPVAYRGSQARGRIRAVAHGCPQCAVWWGRGPPFP